MSHPSPTGNGCTLEDCHTNLFALTDLSGIKWRKLTAESVPVVDPLDDPVLVSFAKCMQSDILCVWRRVQKHVDPSNCDQLPFSKELWIFWYGEKPANLDDILSPELTEVENGSWDHGLSYECRTLLFKALHQLIERCLLSRNFIRLGKWFVQPYDQLQAQSDKSAHLSFSFNYFLHGESTVCASIEVKQHPPVWRLAPHHLALAQSNQASVQVILAPYGLNGNLTGQRLPETDQNGRKLLEDWKMFYSVDGRESEASGDTSRLPSLVEVVVAGVRMRYPSCFVLVCEPEECPARMQAVINGGAGQAHSRPQTLQSQMSSIPLTPPTSPADPSLMGMTETNIKVVPTPSYQSNVLESHQAPHTVNTISQKIVEKVCQDCCTTAGTAKRTSDMSSEESAGVWELSEPTSRCNCSCSRHKATKNKSGALSQGKSGSGTGSKHAKGDKGDKSDRQSGRPNRSMTPFHRRSPVTDDLLQFDMDMIMARMPPNPAFRVSQVGPTNASTPTPTALPQLPRNPSMEASMDSPSSPSAPSPLDDQHNPGMMSQSMEPTMPELSPHPPAKHAGDKERGEKPQTTAPSENSNSFNGTMEVFGKPVDSTPGSARPEPSVVSPCNGGPPVDHNQESVNSWLHSQRQLQVDTHGIKRPSLPQTDITNEDEISTESFYDFKSLHSWFEYPIKKARLDAKGDLSKSSHLQFQTSLNQYQKQQSKTPSPIPKNDPYEFQDDLYMPMAPGGFSRYRTSRDDSIPRPSPFGRSMDDDSRDSMHNDGSQIDLDSPSGQGGVRSLGVFTREKDLQASIKDLDHMFDSSEEDNDDMALPPTPASSNKPEEPSTICRKVTSISANTMGTIGPSELTRMFPTPPSLSDNNHTHSPGPGTDLGVDAPEGMCTKVEPFTGTTTDTTSKDWSYVFKPPKYCQFLGSNRYSPVELPSGTLSPVHSPPDYKASWQYAIPIMEKQPPPPSTYINIPSIETVPSLSRLHPGTEASPATFHGSIQQRTPRTPMSYELQSPASNASSYMNRTLNSIDNQATNHQIAEVHSLVVNIILMDSLLNVYKDHNFDSCNICVCNMSIKGADFGLYLSNVGAEPQGHCQCAFSAIMNRKYGHNSGLFYEDEVDITGIRNDRFDRRKPPLRAIEYPPREGGENKPPSLPEDDVNPTITELLLSQFVISNPSCSVIHLFSKLMTDAATSWTGPTLDMLQMQDGNEAAYAAMEQGRQAMEHCSPTKMDDAVLKASSLHKWPYLGAHKTPVNPQNVVRLLKSLLPLLQEAIQKKRTTRLWEPTYEFSVTGPLSWKDFHKMAGRGNNESCEPQPIPSFLVGHDKEWMSISPFALKYWDKLLLEPYGKPRDVVYVVVSPDSDYVLTHVKRFFKELSTVYELSRLGKHSPMSKVLRDGIMRVGKKAQNLGKEQVEDWFLNIGESPVAAKLRLYFLTCRYHLAPFLAQQTLDKHLLESTGSGQQKPPFRSHPEPSPKPPATPDNSAGGTTPQHGGSEENKDGSNSTYDSSHVRDSISHDTDSDDNEECPALVVYLVDPFTYSQQWDHLNRLAMVGLLRCYESMLRYLPEHLQNNTFLQIVPLKMILDKQEPGAEMQHLKSMAFSVFTMCRWNLSHTIPGRSLTGMGPAAAADLFLKSKGGDKAGPLKLYAPPYVLAPLKDKQSQLAESCGEKLEKSNVIFCGYCLSEDQRWLLATFTDQRGEMTEMCTVNIEIPNRNRRRKASARKIGLGKLWDFILGVISMTTTPCRVVIGRFGRLGHGELKVWGGLLSKKNLIHASKLLREMCGQCSAQTPPSSDLPCILSACLVSMEPHSTFRVMPESVKVEEKMSSNCPLQTPRDASCTHILVFPTSTTAQANTQSNYQEPNMDLTLVLNDDEGDLMFDDTDLDISTLFENVSPPTSPQGQMQNVISSPHGGSPTGRPLSPGKNNWPSMGGVGPSSMTPQEEVCNLLLQPLAMGYYTSTAKTGPLPRWFWASCPEAEHHCPAMFKAALHIHCPSVQQNLDELIDPSHSRNAHSLDSSETCDVLRYVLENYNALSWLNLDPACNDRRSCLPIHFVNLMQIYHALNAFV